MTTSQRRNAEQILIEEFMKDLESTAEQVQQLLTDIRDSKLGFVEIKTELRFLIDNVKDLSSIIKDGGGSGSVLTRLALIEKDLIDIKKYIVKDTDDDAAIATKIALLEKQANTNSQYVESQKNIVSKKTSGNSEASITGRWKLYITIAGGIFTLLGSIIALLISMMSN